MVEIYTDGACSGNPGPGGWAWATAPTGTPHDSGGEARTTNQRMEVRAVLEALRAHAGVDDVTIVSDSTYVVNCFKNRWYVNWLRNGWRNSQRQPVANRDLWQPLVELYLERSAAGRVPQLRWVKGHSGDPMNDIVDRLAVAAAVVAATAPARPPSAPPGDGSAGVQGRMF